AAPREPSTMPQATDLPTASFALAAGLCLIALFLGLREWYERSARETRLSEADHAHFSRQDSRRRLGISVLLAIALCVLFGSRIGARVEGLSEVLFLLLWVGVLALILLLLVLALLDWSATRAYGRRRRREMLRESLDAIHSETRENKGARTGQDSREVSDLPDS